MLRWLSLNLKPKLKMEKNLYDCLSHLDIILVKNMTNIRNCKVKDLTIAEVKELNDLLQIDFLDLIPFKEHE